MSDLACSVPFGNAQIVVWAQGFALTMVLEFQTEIRTCFVSLESFDEEVFCREMQFARK